MSAYRSTRKLRWQWRALAFLAALAVVRPDAAIAAIVIDRDSSAATAGDQSTLSWSHQVGAGSDRALYVTVAINGDKPLASVTYGAVFLSLVGESYGDDGKKRLSIYRLIAPTVGTANIVVTLTDKEKFVAGATSFTGVDQANPNGPFYSTFGDSLGGSLLVPSNVGGVVLDGLMAEGDAGGATAGTGQAQRWARQSGTGGGDTIGRGTTKAGAASVTLSWNLVNKKRWTLGAISLNASTGVAGPPSGGSATIMVDRDSSAATKGDQVSLSWSHQVGAGSDRVLYVTVAINGERPIASVTYGGLALTLVGSTYRADEKHRLAIYRLIAPAVGTANIVVTLTDQEKFVAGATSFTGVDQAMPNGSYVSNLGTGFTASINVVSVAGAVILDGLMTKGDSDGANGGANQALRWAAETGDGGGEALGRGSTKSAAGNTAMTWALVKGKPWIIGAIALKPAAGPTGLRIAYTNFGLFCLNHSITITAIDGAGAAYTGYSGTIGLTTSTARGTWSLVSGGGALTDPVADDGAASYAWNPSSASATFQLSYRAGPSVVTVSAVDSTVTSIKDDGTQGAITFSPSGFTVTSAPFSNPAGGVPAFASPQIAGTPFSMHLTAYGQTPTDPTCGIITSYAGTKSLRFWSSYVNPASGTIAATVNGAAIATSEAAAAAQNVAFTNGQAVVTANYNDAGSLSLSMKDSTTGNPALPNGIRGSTGTFVSRPATLLLSNIRRSSDGFANPGASSSSDTVFIAAGRPFTATVTAVTSSGTPTPNFGRESPAATIQLTPALVLPATGNLPAITGSFTAFSGGAATGAAFAWPEVGIVRMTPTVANYLNSGTISGTQSGNVGRFIPDRFEVALNTPVFGTGCTAGSYTYVGQPFTYTVAPVITVTARALGGSTTQNYTGSLLRLTNASLTGRSYSAASGTLDTSGVPAPTADPAIVDAGSGVATLTFSAGSGLSFSRASPVAPFNANVSLGQNVIDLDAVVASNPVTFGAGAGIAFSTGASQRYGRLVLRNSVGSELLDLPMSFTAQYYINTATGFTTNTADSCSAAPPIVLSGYQGSLSSGETCVRDTGTPGISGAGCAVAATPSLRYRATPLAGDFNLVLAAPGAGNSGAAIVTAVAPPWLRYDWNTSVPGLENPSAMASFGLFPGPPSRIFQREIY